MNMAIFLSKLYLLTEINNLHVIWLSDTDIISHSLKENLHILDVALSMVNSFPRETWLVQESPQSPQFPWGSFSYQSMCYTLNLLLHSPNHSLLMLILFHLYRLLFHSFKGFLCGCWDCFMWIYPSNSRNPGFIKNKTTVIYDNKNTCTQGLIMWMFLPW